jgi:excisionase family DNA binding protein
MIDTRRVEHIAGEPAADRIPGAAHRLEPALLRVEDAARYLSLGRSKTYELIARGELPVVRIGRSVRVPLSALRAWIQAQIPAPTGDDTSGGR